MSSRILIHLKSYSNFEKAYRGKISLSFQISDMRASGVPRHSRTSTKPNEIPRELGVWCEKCNNRLVELKRQVMRMILPEIQGVLQKDRRLKNNAVRLQTTITFLFRNHCSAGWNLKSAFTLSYWNVIFSLVNFSQLIMSENYFLFTR